MQASVCFVVRHGMHEAIEFGSQAASINTERCIWLALELCAKTNSHICTRHYICKAIDLMLQAAATAPTQQASLRDVPCAT